MDVKEYINRITGLSGKDFPSIVKAIKEIPTFQERVSLVLKLTHENQQFSISTKFGGLASEKEVEDAMNYYFVEERLVEDVIHINNLENQFRISISYEDVGHVFHILNGKVKTIAFSDNSYLQKLPKSTPEQIKQAFINAFSESDDPKKLAS